MALALTGCATQDPLVRIEYVEVPVAVREKIPDAMLEPCIYDRPGKECGDRYCNGQLARMILDLSHHLARCNAQIEAIKLSGEGASQ